MKQSKTHQVSVPQSATAALPSEVAVNARLLKVGLEVFPIYGDDKAGYSVDPSDLYPTVPPSFRWRSLEEAFFALVNLNISPEGQA